MTDWLSNLDRRWIFLAMFLAVAIPVLWPPTLPEQPTPIVQAVFDTIEALPPDSVVVMALDYDPASRPELGPMLTSFTRHCAMRGHRMFFLTLWPTGAPIIDDALRVLETEFPDRYQYGENYLSLGYGAGYEAAIKLIATDLLKLFPVDTQGRPVASYPVARNISSLQDTDLVISIGAGYPGTKEWVQYAATPYQDIRVVAGVTGVSAPPQYPYYPQQLLGMLPAIKGAAEYEFVIGRHYGTRGERLAELLSEAVEAAATDERPRDEVVQALAESINVGASHVEMLLDGRINCMSREQISGLALALEMSEEHIFAAAEADGCVYAGDHDYPSVQLNYGHNDYQEALGRMGPQLSAHILMLVLIVLGNVIFFLERRRGRR